VNEPLAYYQDRASTTAIQRVVLSFVSSTEISAVKGDQAIVLPARNCMTTRCLLNEEICHYDWFTMHQPKTVGMFDVHK